MPSIRGIGLFRSRRRLAAVACTVALVAAACGGSSPSADEAPRADQDLRVAAGPDPFPRQQGGQGQGGQGQGGQGGQGQQGGGLGGQGQGGGGGGNQGGTLGPRSNRVNMGMFETLTRLTPSFGVAPALAQRWEAVTPTRWRFTLRPNIVFHNGEPLTAAAVVPILDGAARRQDPIRGLTPTSAEAVGERVLEINLSVANLRLPEQLSSPSLGISAPNTTGGRGEDAATTPTGTGPFRFHSYTAGESLRVVANEQYWAEPPRVRSITFRFGDDAESKRLLAAGEVDVALQTSPREETGSPSQPVVSNPAQAVYLLLNATGTDEWAVLADPGIRHALALAFDRESFTKASWAERGEANHTFVPPSILRNSRAAVASPDQDLTEARRLLDQAGWVAGPDGVRVKDGKPLALSVLLSTTDLQPSVKAMQDQLALIGATVRQQEPGEALPLQIVNQGRFHLYLESRLQDDANPCSFCRFFSTHSGGLLAVSTSVDGGPRANELFEQAFTTPESTDAVKLAADLLHEVTAERFVAVPLALVGTGWLVAPAVRGFAAAPVPGAQSWAGIWLV